jgi:hypothetical protein
MAAGAPEAVALDAACVIVYPRQKPQNTVRRCAVVENSGDFRATITGTYPDSNTITTLQWSALTARHGVWQAILSCGWAVPSAQAGVNHIHLLLVIAGFHGFYPGWSWLRDASPSICMGVFTDDRGFAMGRGRSR